jgi:hypothetical protein
MAIWAWQPRMKFLASRQCIPLESGVMHDVECTGISTYAWGNAQLVVRCGFAERYCWNSVSQRGHRANEPSHDCLGSDFYPGNGPGNGQACCATTWVGMFTCSPKEGKERSGLVPSTSLSAISGDVLCYAAMSSWLDFVTLLVKYHSHHSRA